MSLEQLKPGRTVEPTLPPLTGHFVATMTSNVPGKYRVGQLVLRYQAPGASQLMRDKKHPGQHTLYRIAAIGAGEMPYQEVFGLDYYAPF